jgi:hypothetical protein
MGRDTRVARRACAALLAVSAGAHAAPFNTWGVHVGEGVAGVTAYAYGRDAFGPARFLAPVVYGEFGVTSTLELDVGVGGVLGGEQPARTSVFELMTRAFVTRETALVLHATLDRTSDLLTLGPELHGVYALPAAWDLTVNALWAPRVEPQRASLGLAALTVAPEYHVAPGLSAFVELVGQAHLDDTRFARGGRLYAEAVPGVAFRIGAMHELCTGVGVPVVGAPFASGYVGVWYSVASSGGPVRVP